LTYSLSFTAAAQISGTKSESGRVQPATGAGAWGGQHKTAGNTETVLQDRVADARSFSEDGSDEGLVRYHDHYDDAEAEQQEAESAYPAPTSAPKAEGGTTQRRVVLDFDVMYEIAANITDKHRREGMQLFARQMKEAQARELAEARFVWRCVHVHSS
jgi:hypothetical protein